MATDVERFDIPAPDHMDGLAQALDRHVPSNIRRLALLVKVGGEYEDGAREKAKALLMRYFKSAGFLSAPKW